MGPVPQNSWTEKAGLGCVLRSLADTVNMV